ncbi:hypothetical protein pkur_cds_779 [Pandoravirus kuranda]|uniref:Uncharacterized protein n=1 Tax=Pandoravirus kuranda TaxID=3019033 RepID=A0AA95J4P9_9VIRU|nr:hypothetical protein pkur_cds_779 [Pandoravirus kuranda]
MTTATWRRSIVAALVLAGALAAAAVVCAATLVVRHHLRHDTYPWPIRTNDTDGAGHGNPEQGDGGQGDDDPDGPTSDDDNGGCTSISRARRCTSRCNCVWCPPGHGFGCHDLVAGERPCGARDGRRLSPWACDTHLMTWLSVGGAGLVCAFFVGFASVVWCAWPRLCRRNAGRRTAAGGGHMSAASPLIDRRAINDA